LDEKEKRRYARFQINRPCHISISGGPSSNAQLINVSETGMALLYSTPIAPGTIIALSFHVNLHSEKVQIDVRGRAIHSRQDGGSHVVGLELVDVTAQTTGTLRRLIEMLNLRAQTDAPSR